MRLLRRYDKAGLVHAMSVMREVWTLDVNTHAHSASVAICTKGELVKARGAVTDDNITCLRCLAMNLVGELS